MLTTQILVKNNEKTIEKTLNSIKSLNSKIIIGNLNSADKTLEICSKYKAEIINIKNIDDYSQIRNSLSGNLNFYINPGEVLSCGHEALLNLSKTSNVYVFQNDVISKQIRFWTKEDKFVNPIFETIVNKNAPIEDEIVIHSKSQPIQEGENKINLEIVLNWIKNKPFDLEPYYYLSTCYLSVKDYNRFIFYANEYLNRENKINSSFIMLKYYLSQVYLYLGKVKESAECILFCLSYFPSHAEFWCLLGDIYYRQKKWEKSKCFYENAIILGSKRKRNDDLPIEINKYKEYPDFMINKILDIKKSTNIMA